MSSDAAAPLVLPTRSETGKVAILTLNRPKALNALSSELMAALNEELLKAENEEAVGCVVITGSEKAFAAGADIKEMKDQQFSEVYKKNFLASWTQITTMRKPIIGAVSGFALGGGCELAMMCDILIASPTAKFGQPEINLGIIPGAGGTQRLLHALGKSRAMSYVLTGDMWTAEQASSWGLVSQVSKPGEGECLKEAVEMAEKISSKGRLSVLAGKESINYAVEQMGLESGLKFERKAFQSLFATSDQKEGMAAFAEKRKAEFKNA